MNWQEKRTMESWEYALALQQLNLSKAAAARFLGVSERTSHRYYDGKRPVPAAQAMLLNSLIERNEMPLVPARKPNGVRQD